MKLPRLIWVDENNEPISLRSWLRSLFSKSPPPPEPGTVAWLAAQDNARLRGEIAKHLAQSSPYSAVLAREFSEYSSMLRGRDFKNRS